MTSNENKRTKPQAWSSLKTLIALMILCVATITTIAAQAEPLTVTARNPWKTITDNANPLYVLDFTGQKWPRLNATCQLEPKTFYAVKWKMKSSMTDLNSGVSLVIDLPDKKGRQSYGLVNDWADYAAYFYTTNSATNNAKDSERADFRLIINPGANKTIEVKDMTVNPVTAKRLTENLFPNGSFENASAALADWTTYGDARVTIAKHQGFLCGENSAEIEFGPKSGVRSLYVPTVPGKTYELRVWAKARDVCHILLKIKAKSPFAPKRPGVEARKVIRVTKEWREYSLTIKIPDNIDARHGFRDHLARVLFFSRDKAATVYVDDIVFRQR